MILFALLNRTIDLGNEVILARGFPVPSTYREILVVTCPTTGYDVIKIRACQKIG
jgi:hypothetical protein